MKAIRLVNGHFDGMTESGTPAPRQELHKKLPHGEWVNNVTGLPMTHDVYRLSGTEKDHVYNCVDQAIEKSTWLKVQELKVAAKASLAPA